MNPFTLIGFFLALFYAIKHANAIPVTSDATNSATLTDSTTTLLNNDEKMNRLLYKTADTSGSVETVNLNQSAVETTTRKSHNEESKVRRRRRPRKPPTNRSDCRTTQPAPPKVVTTRTPKANCQFPSLFISNCWGRN